MGKDFGMSLSLKYRQAVTLVSTTMSIAASLKIPAWLNSSSFAAAACRRALSRTSPARSSDAMGYMIHP